MNALAPFNRQSADFGAAGAHLDKLDHDLEYFSARTLQIRDKTGALVPFYLNRAQKHVHNLLEAQRAKTGKVRALAVKGRQEGFSTYVQGRFYHKLWRARSHQAIRAFILTHEQDATDNLFSMAQRFHEHMPPALQKPLKRGNAKELLFADNDCGYQVSTAGSRETGRSATFQLFHGSEVAFWPNAEDHAQASFQAVGDVPGTEIILESTANGVGNLFHRLAQAAIRGQSQFQAIFVPWYWDDGYQAPCPDHMEFSPVWEEYALAHKLSWPQLAWAWNKNRELASTISASLDEPCWKFMQEYPATFDEAFQTSGNSFIPAPLVLKARRPAETVLGTGPIILGVDPARSGDKVGIIDRCGRRAGERIAERMDPQGDTMYVASQIAKIIDRIRPDAVCIDVGSNGAGVYDWLADKQYPGLYAVNFGSNPVSTTQTGDDQFFNRRAEMYDGMREWFSGPLPVQIPDDDALQGDICAAQWGPGATRYNTSNELIIEEKAAIKVRLGASPDLGDALALTFAVPYATKAMAMSQPRREFKKRRRSGY